MRRTLWAWRTWSWVAVSGRPGPQPHTDSSARSPSDSTPRLDSRSRSSPRCRRPAARSAPAAPASTAPCSHRTAQHDRNPAVHSGIQRHSRAYRDFIHATLVGRSTPLAAWRRVRHQPSQHSHAVVDKRIRVQQQGPCRSFRRPAGPVDSAALSHGFADTCVHTKIGKCELWLR